MKHSIIIWQVGGITFSAILGTILHFLYEWTGLEFISTISAINESTWEHMKLLFFPTFFYAIVQWFFFRKEYNNFWWIKVLGITVGLITIPVLFYTYNGAIGLSPDWYNILTFFISLFHCYFIEYLLFKNNKFIKKLNFIPFIILSSIAVLFVVFTFSPPNLPLFISPV